MTNKAKLEKIKKLADAMYYAAQYLTTDASRLHKAMEEYHQFIINEYHKEEPTIPDIVDEHFWKMLGEEPVSDVWHDMSEEAENGRNIIIIDPKGFYGAVLRKGGSQLRNHNKERYVKWAYIDDIINVTNREEPVSEQDLSNVERTVKNWKEPVSEELEEASKEWDAKASFTPFYMVLDDNGNPNGVRQDYTTHTESFKAGAKWQIAKLMANATSVTVHKDAGGYPYIPQMELYDYDNDIPLTKEGDKYKVVLIKEE